MTTLGIVIATYPDVETAQQDDLEVGYLLRALDVPMFDRALVRRDADKVDVLAHHESTTSHGAGAGVMCGALLGLMFPPAIIVGAIVGSVAGGTMGAVAAHLWRGLSRHDLHELGMALDDHEAALVVVAPDASINQIEPKMRHAVRVLRRENVADATTMHLLLHPPPQVP